MGRVEMQIRRSASAWQRAKAGHVCDVLPSMEMPTAHMQKGRGGEGKACPLPPLYACAVRIVCPVCMPCMHTLAFAATPESSYRPLSTHPQWMAGT